MAIYTVYKEEVEKFRMIKEKITPKQQNATKNSDDRKVKDMSFSSGNIFDSLGNTNPELFNREKMKSLLEDSTNLVEDFNKYLIWIINSFNDQAKKVIDEHDGETRSVNTAVWNVLMEDFDTLQTKYGLSGKEATEAVFGKWIPESLTEEGCRKLLETRMKNNRLLTDALTKMIKTNYQILGISAQSAEALLRDLNDDNDSDGAVNFIKKVMDNPSILKKFKLGTNNYDFRSIGGAVLFLSSDAGIQLSERPSKNLEKIFRYDAIVVAHGGDQGTSYYTAKDIYNAKSKVDEIKKELKDLIDDMKEKLATSERWKEMLDQYGARIDRAKTVEELDDLIDKMWTLIKYDREFDVTKWFTHRLSVLKDLIKSIEDPKQAMMDKDARNWSCQPIDTLTTLGNERMIDVIRALKKEGFKNIFIGACNPGGFQLPRDLTQDKDFKVHYGTASVYAEDSLIVSPEIHPIYETYVELDNLLEGSEYRYMGLENLYKSYEELYCEAVVLKEEGFLDKLKAFAKKVVEIIIAIWKKIIEFIINIFNKIKDTFINKFGKGKKIKKKVEAEFITLAQDGKASKQKVNTDDTEELKKAAINANSSINAFVKKRSSEEKEWFNRMQQKINTMQQNPKSVNNESGIFESVEFLNN